MAEQLETNNDIQPQNLESANRETELDNPEYFYFRVSSTLLSPESAEMLDLQAFLSVLNAYKFWVYSTRNDFSEDTLGKFSIIKQLQFYETSLLKKSPLCGLTKENIADLERNQRVSSHSAQELRQDIYELLPKIIGENDSFLPDDTQFLDLKVNNDDDPTMLAIKIDRFVHDFGNQITGISLNIDLLERSIQKGSDQKIIDQLKLGLAAKLPLADRQLTSAKDVLQNRYAQEKLNIKTSIMGKLENWHADLKANGIDLSFDFPEELTSREHAESWGQFNVIYEESWLQRLLDNIKENTKKAYQRVERFSPYHEKRMSLHVRFSEDKKNLIAVFEDRATGYIDKAEEIVRSGKFPPNFTDWGEGSGVTGTGTGMAGQQDAIENHYHGKLIPENVMEGDQVIGARLTLILPVVE